MKAYEIQAGSTSLDGLKLTERPDPKPGPSEVIVRVRAASLNARDQGVVMGRYRFGALDRATIPLSDGAGEVIEIGAAVDRFKVGDRVCPTFQRGWLDGPYRAEYRGGTLGAPHDGVLAEQVAVDQTNLVTFPDHLTFEEAATLPCAGVTAWHALMGQKTLQAGESVLVIGTGGVAVFGMLFAKMAGARAFAVSSSDAKLQRAISLGAEGGVNYRTTPDWGPEIVKLTGGRGVDHVVELGGETLPRSISALAIGGHIHVIGFVAGRNPTFAAPEFALMGAHINGIMVGSRALFEAMNAAIGANGFRPVIDRVFAFDEARAAYEYQSSPELFGKVVIAI